MLKSKKKICIIGLGYVGMPLAYEFSKYFNVVGYDINNNRINQLKAGIDKNRQINQKSLKNCNVNFTKNISDLSNIDYFYYNSSNTN